MNASLEYFEVQYSVKKIHIIAEVVHMLYMIHWDEIMHIRCKDGRFDKAVAGNVIHLLPALQELWQN